MRSIKILFFILVIVITNGCSVFMGSSSGKAIKLSEVRGDLENATEQEITVNREEYKKRLLKGNVNTARLVEIFRRNANAADIPEYRFLDIKPGSVYELVGIENLDVLIGANDYIVGDQQTFFRYLHAIRDFEEAFIEVRRNDSPLVLKIKFT